MEEAQHQYRPLRKDESIRVLTLDPGKHGDTLTGALEHVSVDNPGRYEALSYVWADSGPPDTAYDILIRDDDGVKQRLALRGGSIFAALNQLRLSDRPRRIWADQCCINQDDLVERSQQLQFMNKIYRDATQVLAWLGRDTKNEATSAFNLIRELDAILESHTVDGVFRNLGESDLERRLTDGRETLRALTSRAWFRRGWIVQEIGTGAPATIKWGDAEISWETLAKPDETTHHANRFNFIYELQRARHLHFSDDRDRIFAFLGHFSVHSLHPLACGPVSIMADYAKTVEETYIDLAVGMLRANPAALCIVLAAVQHRRGKVPSYNKTRVEGSVIMDTSSSYKSHLPSWVPDWRWFEGIILAEPICPHRAHRNSNVKFEIIEKEQLLVLQAYGIEIDVVAACSQPMLSRGFYERKLPGQPPSMIEGLWSEICRKKDFNLNDRYLNDQPAFFAFMQTLSNGCVQAAGHEGTPYEDVSDDVWLQKAARYVVETLDRSVGISRDILDVAEATKHEDHHEKWSRWATSASESRIFAETRNGYYVLGPAALEVGDIANATFMG
ncbi:hypothetical protein NPX13_g3907 [Xylaria arbuscula]|uniref:Heterokaryon incompatibility domain-containing protein n=1 Tax=Xylaria arbuscula TaxID=114810 RepID=A0A9W8NH11_9PEZI|nr:hypothetical protein NPX13_g3907 [Xylaria arbuscula]